LLVCGGLSSFGDATGDGQVDLNDHAVMRAQFGASTEPEFPVLTADFDDDCDVDLTDFNYLKNNFWIRVGGNPIPTANISQDLVLEYNSGAFHIRNTTAAPISFVGYTVADPQGRLSSDFQNWDLLSNETATLGPGAIGLSTANPTPFSLSEIILPPRIATLAGNDSVSIGNPFPGVNPAELGDVSFMFLRAGSMTAEGSNVIAPTGSPVGTPMDVDAADNVVAEDASPGATVGITAFAAEPDASDTVVYILDNDAGGLFAIDATSGIVTLNGSVDYEGVRHFDIVVRAMSTDGSSSTASFGIDVSDLDEFDISSTVDQDDAPNVAAEDSVEGQSVGITAFAIDADGSAVLSYSLDDDADGLFTIHADTGVVMLAGPLNYEMATSHTIVARSTSSDGSSTVATWMIDVLDVDEFDVGLVADQDAAANAVLENSAVGTSVGIVAFAVDEDGSASVSYSLADDAGGLFAIDPTTGAVTVAGGLDFESAVSHAVTVRGESTDGSFSTEQFTIDVLDVDEFDVTPIVDQDGGANLVAENSAPGTPVGITAFAEDEDGSDAVFYSLEDDAGGLFAIDASTGVVSAAGEFGL